MDVTPGAFTRRSHAAKSLLQYAQRSVPSSALSKLTVRSSGMSAHECGQVCWSEEIGRTFPDSDEIVELRSSEGTWVSTSLLLPRRWVTLGELYLLQHFFIDAMLVRPLLKPLSQNDDGQFSGQTIYKGFQACVGRRQACNGEDDILASYVWRHGATGSMPRRCDVHQRETKVVVALLWRWFKECAPTQAAEHTKIIQDHDLWEHCLVPGIPVLALVLTTSWSRAIHRDKVVAPLFGVWLTLSGCVQTGGNFGFPLHGWRHTATFQRDAFVRLRGMVVPTS